MQRMTRLDGLRGVLAVYVMLGHAMPFVVAPGWVAAALRHGEAAVDLFFCLSGLVVVQSLERFGHAAWPFLQARARRLLPVYFVVLGASVLLLAAGSPLPEMPWVGARSAGSEIWGAGLPAGFFWHLLAHVTLVQGVIPQGLLPWAFVTLLGPAWSLSTEWQFYLLVAALRVRNLAALAVLLLAVALGYRSLAPELPPYWGFSRAFLPDAAGYFALGVASAVWLRGGGAWVFGAVLAAVCGVELVSGAPWKAVTPVIWGVVMAGERWPGWGGGVVRKVMGYAPSPLRGGGANPSYGFRGFLDWRVVQWLGAVSYPLYLVNEPVQLGCAMMVAPLAHGDAWVFTAVWLPLAVVAPVAVAAVVHRVVEVPRVRRGPGLWRVRASR
jgi:peptidoglycan/LPS O-acetylase OafA/YrhL